MAEQLIYKEFDISPRVVKLFKSVDNIIQDDFCFFDNIAEYNQYKVLAAFHKNMISESHLTGTTGYGYGDKGRDTLDRVFSDIFHTEDALVRSQIINGTHAIATCLYGVLRPGDELLSVTGKPYDTLEEVIGIRGNGAGSLKDFGINYRQVDLLPEGIFDFEGIKKALTNKTRMVFIQRSRGYSYRPAIKIDEIEEAISFIKALNNDVVVMVDNCYGEFVEKREPSDVGADIIAGSLIKNPGGGIAQTGGYIAGRKDLIDLCAYRLTTQGIGKEAGASQENNRLFYQGIFMAPHVVSESLKGAVLCAAVMQKLGFDTSPSVGEKRSDLIQAVKFNDRHKLIAFCRGIQKSAPIDSFVTPEPWDMPGYDTQVIMAAGTFVQGATSELSVDGPCDPPYIAYMQGGLIYEHVKLGLMMAVDMMLKDHLIEL